MQDVEMWVVEAISQSPPLLEASMDQFNSVVTITYVHYLDSPVPFVTLRLKQNSIILKIRRRLFRLDNLLLQSSCRLTDPIIYCQPPEHL